MCVLHVCVSGEFFIKNELSGVLGLARLRSTARDVNTLVRAEVLIDGADADQ
jgi:hypothetical protein